MSEIQLTAIKKAEPEYGSLKERTQSPNDHVINANAKDGHVNGGYTPDSLGNGAVKNESALPNTTTVKPPEENLNSQQNDYEKKDLEAGGATTFGQDDQPNCCLQKIQSSQQKIGELYTKHQLHIRWTVYAILLILYAIYFAFAMSHRFGDEGSIRLLWITCVAVALIIITIIKDNWGTVIYDKVLLPPTKLVESKWTICKWLFIGAAFIAFALYVGIGIAPRHTYNLVSLAGLVVFVLLLFIFSKNPARVHWRPVFWGLGIQFVFALIIIRTSWGYQAFNWLGERIREFLNHTDAGARFVFGEKFMDHPFAFKVLPTIVFFSTCISVLYYLGVMQAVILKLGWLMQTTLGTTAGESLNAAGNIFLGQTEAPLLVRPLIKDMTVSELHAIMTGGFASIAGTVMATFILFGVPPNHLLTASVMAAPAALAISKLFYPETEESKMKDEVQLEKAPQRNVIEAASSGASAAIKLVANIAANLIAFLSLLAFVNATLRWLGARVGLEPPNHPPLTFQLICSYVFWPISFLMGTVINDCRKMGELLGMKIFINEFVAYRELGTIINNTEALVNYNATVGGNATCVSGDIFLPGHNVTLTGGILQPRSVVIATYALCGFANISSLGITVGALGAMAPSKKSTLAKIAVRALVAANCANFINACLSGLLYQGPSGAVIYTPC